MPVKSERNPRVRNRTRQVLVKYVDLEGKNMKILSSWTYSMECVLITLLLFL